MIVRYADAAKRDLIAIWRFSRRRWGDERAARYVKEIDAKVCAIAEGRRRARPCPDVAPELSVIRCRSHNIYLRAEGEYLNVIAVLHQKMDQRRHIRKNQ